MITKRKIVLDFDDTIIKSREMIVKLLNEKNGTNKTVEDIKEWNYKSIDENVTPNEIRKLYESHKFFAKVDFYEGVLEFIDTMKDKYTFIVCSVGSEKNLEQKKEFVQMLGEILNADMSFIGIEFDIAVNGKHLKNGIDFSDCECAIDDNTHALLSMNVKTKILFKPNIAREWNRIPRNAENFYVVNNYHELLEMFKFNEMLKEEGIKLGTL